jgi:hypothetical protein
MAKSTMRAATARLSQRRGGGDSVNASAAILPDSPHCAAVRMPTTNAIPETTARNIDQAALQSASMMPQAARRTGMFLHLAFVDEHGLS